MNDVKILICV